MFTTREAFLILYCPVPLNFQLTLVFILADPISGLLEKSDPPWPDSCHSFILCAAARRLVPSYALEE